MKNKNLVGKFAVKTLQLGFIILLLAVQIFPQSGDSSSCNSSKTSRYPNELPDFKFYETAKWRSLTFLESTMDDVRQVMGEPTKVIDTAQLTTAYPGDAKSLQPVFIYDGNEWNIHVYFGKYCYYTTELPEIYKNRLCEVVLHPKKTVPADKIQFPGMFEKKTKKLPDGSWDEFRDGGGLTYVINYEDSTDGINKAKYLGNITYGISKSELRGIVKSETPTGEKK